MKQEKFKKLIFYFSPLLFLTFPILVLAQFNLSEIDLVDIMRPIVLSWLIFYPIFIIFGILVRDKYKGYIISFALNILFFSYGHIFLQVNGIYLFDYLISRSSYLVILFGLIFVLLFIWINRRKSNSRIIVEGIAVISSILVLFSIFNIATYQFQEQNLIISHDKDILESNKESIPTQLFDIYYIVLDGYGREDVLQEKYSYDNSQFIDSLLEKGFFVAEESFSNYNRTILSLSSSLSMEYLDTVLLQSQKIDPSHELYREIIRQNLVMNYFSEMGFTTVSLESSYNQTNVNAADIKIEFNDQPISSHITAFEGLIIKTTALRIFLDIGFFANVFPIQEYLVQNAIESQYSSHRYIFEESFDFLKEISLMEGDYFVFAHIISPHPPFVFDSTGNTVSPPRVYSISDGSDFLGSREEYRKGYIDQLTYTNTRVLETIDFIIANSDSEPIIIIQGDHGPGMDLDWDSLEDTDTLERMSILNAYFFPNQNYEKLYYGISPVNTFRLIFQQFYNFDFDMLPDHSYFSLGNQWENFIDVTDEILMK